jgi:hypothetical protein
VTATAFNLRDSDHPVRLVRTDQGAVLTRYYLVKGAADVIEAATATGLPALGSAYAPSGLGSLLICRRVQPVTNTLRPTETEGTFVIEAEWRTADWGGVQRPTPVRNGAWLVIEPETATITQYQDIDVVQNAPAWPGGNRHLPMNNGFGAPREVGLTKAVVCKYVRGDDLTLAYMNTLIDFNAEKYVSADAVTLPGLAQNPSLTYALGAGQVRFRTFELPETPAAYDGGLPLYLLKLHLLLAPDHLYRWQLVDEDGNPKLSTTPVANKQYRTANYAGLF